MTQTNGKTLLPSNYTIVICIIARPEIIVLHVRVSFIRISAESLWIYDA